jgi:hypothetical protein
MHRRARLLLSGPLLALVVTIASGQDMSGHQHGATAGASGNQSSGAMGNMPGMSSTGAMNGMSMSSDFAGIPHTRDASGTAWQPDDTPMHAQHFMAGDWTLMAHYNAFLGYDHQSGPRGDDQFNSINWLMLMATKATADNELTLRAMLSLEPWTTTQRGYPLLFQSGEAYHGRPLVNRQHPHDLFMELAARYRHAFSDRNAFSLYVAPSGEPALGPPAFPHRMSAMDNPAAPISHHWLDSSHISFGVVTAGFIRDKWQLEGSWFNGREPDENRWDIEHPKLDSYSGRFTWNPTPQWSAQVSHGYMKSPEELHPEEHVRRTTASVMHLIKMSGDTHIATTAGWGRNNNDHADNAYLIESNYMTRRFSIFGRAEYVEKTGEELALLPDDRKIPVKQFSVGATHELLPEGPHQLALGVAMTYSVKPRDLDTLYGRHPLGYWIFVRLR